MTITLDLAPDVERRLREKASREGKPVEDYAIDLLQQSLGGENGSSRNEATEESALDRAVAAMTNRTPEQIAEAQARAIQSYAPKRLPPPGVSVFEVIAGKWPGDETDEEIKAALDELS